MKLTILNAVRLYDALSALSNERLPFASARAVVQMRQALAPEKTLMAQEERKLAEQFGGTIDGGTVRFESADASDGFRAAQAIFNVLAPITPGMSEGVFEQRGWYEIKNTKAPCAYVECEFHDVPETAKWIVEHTKEIGDAIAKGICNFYGVAFVPETPPEAEEPKVLYRVQCGAFSKKENAEALVARLKAAGFDAIIK